MRTFRNRTTVLAAATTAALALTLTACGDDGSGTRSERAADSSATTAASAAGSGKDAGSEKGGDDAAETGTKGSTGSSTDTGTARPAGAAKGSGGSGTTGGTSDQAAVALCTAKGLSITAERQDGRKENTETVKEFTVTLKANGGGMAVVKSPAAEGLSVNPQKWATGYWTTELRNGADEF
ncbi:DUF4232 domain-containing protein [Streptomyces fimicarius]|uniref:DUF4232 domain-containing protein n=1 Tax=Streptomyces griseus TaxID=1911 RepID=UPI0036767B85